MVKKHVTHQSGHQLVVTLIFVSEGDDGSAAGAVEDLRDIEGEGAVGVDRLEACRAEMGDGLLADVVPVGAVSFDRVVQVPSGGQDARVDDEGMAVRLGCHLRR